MTRRVGVLPLLIVLGGVLSSGCVSTGTDKGTVADDRPHPSGEGTSRVAAQRDRPSLPRDWRLREPPPAEVGIKQVLHQDGQRESPGAPADPGRETAVEARPASRKGPAPEESSDALPDFEIKTKPEEPLVAALRCYLDKRPAEAVEHIQACDKANQEALLCLLPLAVRLSEGSLHRARPDEMAEMVDGLRGVEASLQKRAALRIEKMRFCRQVRAFGDYEPIEPGQAAFEAGSGGQDGELIQVYVEVRNFASEAQGPFQVTRLASSAEIRDYAHKTVKRVDFDVYTDRCRSPRQDYFIRYSFRVPRDLPPGPYTLWISVKDDLAQPARPPAEKSLDFRVIAGGSARGSRGEPGGLAAR
jgi:hypothetical protein